MATSMDATLKIIPPLDDEDFVLDPDDIAFALAETRINTEEALKNHLSGIRVKAYKVSIWCHALFFSQRLTLDWRSILTLV